MDQICKNLHIHKTKVVALLQGLERRDNSLIKTKEKDTNDKDVKLLMALLVSRAYQQQL